MIVRIGADPIKNWDSRSIWFFAAKIIYYHGALERGAGFDVSFHPDYPKLVATLGAQTARLIGYWNEYLPKLGLLPLLFPLLLGYLSLFRRPLSWMTLVTLSFLRMLHEHSESHGLD